MAYNIAKLIVAGVLVIALVVAILVDDSATDWAVPLLALLVGYVIGNTQVTSRTGATSPIVSKR